MPSAARPWHFGLPTRVDLLKYGAIAIAAVICGALAVMSTQMAVSIVLLVFLLGIRGSSRTAAAVTLWSYWFLVPGLRRVLDVAAPATGTDPLSLFPFLATGLFALLELRETKLDRRARVILATALLSLAIGIPIGFVVSPQAAAFAGLAYGTAISAFVIGWGDATRGVASLEKVLIYLLPLIALYGIAQYLLPLTNWDSHWVATADIASIKAPGQLNHIRVFSTLNSYFPLAIVLSVGLMMGLGIKRRFGRTVMAFAPLIVALAFTYDRSAWLALVIGLIVFLSAARRGGVGRVVGIILVCLAALVVVGGSNPTTRAFTERVTSLGSPSKDVSAQSRIATTEQLVPESLHRPIGAGLGQAGLASERLGGSTNAALANIDDGYLSSLYQSGPFGLLLLLVAIGLSVGAAFRAAKNATPAIVQKRAALLATLVMLLVLLATGEVLFGAPGAIFWYLCGMAVAWVALDHRRAQNAAPDTLHPTAE
jgi:hypothetical protein